MAYTGASRAEGARVQRVGLATSDDLEGWARVPGPTTTADPRWYEQLDDPDDAGASWHDQAWRDPWLVADPAGRGWHALLTARARTGPAWDRGVIGHAWTPDLRRWEPLPPLPPPPVALPSAP